MPLMPFHPIISEWFSSCVGQPTEVQQQAWPTIQSGADALIAAPTGSGKTLAAFLSCIDQLFKQALARELDDHTHVLYVSPLKALSNDIRRRSTRRGYIINGCRTNSRYEPEGFSPDTLAILTAYGHKFTERPGFVASATGIMIDPKGVRIGAIDSRSDGMAVGY